ncbi:hypothetical protein BGW36DRAFT_431454 [Talaromyces proteolyticus]|uniref:Uncharacterized protein n=1 Tax=Talaromyces proteolyticus TaxID=1131652 RepID=A0AAD4PX48_9EURO|nr:uncharacterized protein BGW36DRAFT_431454 [Talaromyces proteolyticus]KAH8692234.1 hypothetical protein BGW36DRAFT_431454 [Talaromyces proteolyticus]
MGIVVKALGAGLGFTSEAIHAARSRSSNKTSASPSPRDLSVQESSEHADVDTITVGEHVPNESVKMPVESIEEKRPSKAEAEYDLREYGSDSDDLLRGIDQDEAIWELDETAQRVTLPTYEESEGTVVADMAEPVEIKEKRENDMVRGLVEIAGPVSSQVQKIPCPVIIPQRRPGRKDRGFVRAYAPLLADCGISQDVFLQFLKDFHKASLASPWIEVIYAAAGIVGLVPGVATAVTGAVVQLAVGTARELQTRHRRNTFLDKVNQDLFMPRGLFAMIMAFTDEVPSQQQEGGVHSKLTNPAGRTLFASERLNINDATAKYSNYNPEASRLKKNLKDFRLTSGRTNGEIELPEAAPLIYPDLDRAAAQAMEGQEKGPEGPRQKLRNSGKWVQDYMDRKAQASYAAKNPESALSVPSSERKGFVSRFNDPNHPANTGSLVSLLTGGKIKFKGPCDVVGEHVNAWRESKDAERVARGQAPRGKKQKHGLIKKVLLQDVLYLLIVNLPTEEEVEQSAAELENFMQQNAPSHN